MTAQPELSIVLPVYNEGEDVEPVLRALSAGDRDAHELVVVYDFDEDTTVPVVARLAAEIPGLRGLRNDLGRGRPQRDEGGDRRDHGPLRPDLDGGRLRRAPCRRPDGRARPRRRRRRLGQPLHAGRPPGRRAAR